MTIWPASSRRRSSPYGRRDGGIGRQELQLRRPRWGSSMINGAHVVVHTKDPEADRALFGDVLKFPSVDAGHGWLIFAMPPSEAAFHDAEENDRHELYLMCDDITATLKDLKSKKVKVSHVPDHRRAKLAT